jgi:PAS domain S-box-containing protein
MFDDNAIADAARTYLLETAPVVALRIDDAALLVDANAQARRLLGDGAIGRPWTESLEGCFAPLDCAALVESGKGMHRLTMHTVSGLPETLCFRFFPLPNGTLALGSLDLQGQESLAGQVLALNDELSGRTLQLLQANTELCQLHDINSRLSRKMGEHIEMLRQQSIASLNLMEDAVAARQRAEQASQEIRESEERFRSLVEGAPDAIYVVSESTFCYVNAAACRLFGADSSEQLVDQSVIDRCHPSTVASVQARVQKLFSQKEAVPTIEQTLLRIDGSPIPVEVTAVPITYKGKDGAVAFARDMTERNKAQEALRNSERRYRSIIESAPDPILVVDQTSRITLINAQAERAFGYQREELLGRSLDLIIPPDLWASQEIQEREVTTETLHAPSVLKGYAVGKDGHKIPVEVRLRSAGDSGPDVMLSISDLSGLRRAEARFERLLEAAPDAIVVANEAGQIVLMNTQAERMFGHSRAALLGRNINLLVPERFWGENSGQRIGLRADGSEFSIEITLSPLQTEGGGLSVSAIRDVTERKENEQRTRQLEILAAKAEAANKAKSMFLSTMSHEIRTPMNAILGYSQLTLRDPSLGAGARANLEVINRSGEHLLAIIDDVLDMAKIEAGRTQVTPTTFNLRNLLREIESMFRLRAEAKRLRFEVLVQGEPIQYVVADEGKIRQVLINLLGNAVKFTERGRINLNVSLNYRTNERLWLSAQVEDTGIGLTAEDQSRLFQPFVQGVADPHTLNGGTGLGLAICRGVAHLMRGDITVTSRPGEGSTFSLEIPIDPSDRTEHQLAAGPGRVLGLQAGQDVPRILIVDDVTDNRGWLSELLTTLGFSVRSAANGQDAVRCWEEWHPGLILMDVHMPGMNGLEATRLIKSRVGGKDTVIIALTADAMSDQRRVVMDSEMDDFLSKPCLEDELLEKIRWHLGLEYVYEEVTITSEKEAHVVSKAAVLRPEDLAALPLDLIRQLRDATFNGDKALLNKLILLIDQSLGGESARSLQELANEYQYTKLMELFDKNA